MPPRARIIIADDHTLVAEACKKLLEGDYDVVAVVRDGRALVHSASQLQPNVVVIDINMPLLNGLDAGQQIKKASPAVQLVFLTMSEEPELVKEAFRCGASAYVVKTGAAAELVTAVQEVLSGHTYLSPSLARESAASPTRPGFGIDSDVPLTERQREVLQLLAEGRSMKEVGAILKLTTRTVAFHKYRIMKAVHARNNAELVRYAIKKHILPA
ncbi:two component transcriptional regulator, LuxR family [Candidatus Koribacter versatilis Ellin345]|uniref:Two component transcriptional regulator, LuxR family n=1 Tax=Koribacter versatilis (strain Ellin345) TaxID=204669 RepID=Q1IJ86_KORVE|nr:response regulator transcription factor [Candidatus Koribacter versatilis]ABF43064.1 two component transcriptional regulator, LuxR family [Candidatus Koribacter versatilis Ellin345]